MTTMSTFLLFSVSPTTNKIKTITISNRALSPIILCLYVISITTGSSI